MVVTKGENNLVYDIKISSVVPGKIAGENRTYELKGIDFAMKLHYLKGLYFFNNPNNTSDNEEGKKTSFISILDIKKVMFDRLVVYFKTCGRIRVSSSETGERASIKLNDAGIRIVEAQSSKTVEEWLALEGFLSLQDQLVYNDDGLGPDLPFSPLVCLQVTWFKCGGISVGLSWAHILGDAFSAVEFMNTLGHYIQIQGSNKEKPKLISLQDPPQSEYPLSKSTREPISVKRVDPVGSHWVLPFNSKIGFHTIHLNSNQLGELHSMVHGTKMNDNCTSQFFEVITSIMWKSIAKIRKDLETNVVTICRPKSIKRQGVVPHNGQMLGVVKVNFAVSNVAPLKLVHSIVEGVIDESDMVEELVNKETGESDFFVYGANLTFVDVEKADVYGFEMKEKHPRFASYSIGEIGDKGVVLVLPGPKDENSKGNDAKLIVVQLPEDEIEPLKSELKEKWCIE
ncbi:protein ECERIFERUM 2-like [Chenopodium quinoa]|nr:protein ECERIFERUM 2-like [Chenopodium quinoa]